MRTFVDQMKQSAQLKWNRVDKFKAKVAIYVELGAYVIKTAETPQELLESFKLRDQIFNQEFRGLSGSGLDIDRFDCHFDHLIIVHRELKQIVGTYRLSCSNYSKESYTGLEFNLRMLALQQGPFLELGRACIHKDFRKGSVISLLWRGVAEYMNQSGSTIIYGCSSLKINKARDAALVYQHLLDQKLVTHEYLCQPTKNFLMPSFDLWASKFQLGLSEEQAEEAESLIPSLLKSYLKLGAKVACEPAFDKTFDCIDLLTILRKADISRSLAERFQVVR
jgi:putative hemolysin